ncbi:hypothetical protein, partial [Lacticaseibacillus paracasei]|uniref:hypothetical protein n=1 Tax=Lacticaseibacillus paracasei TaxID=1597 RepID=UPI00195B7CAE
KVASLKVIHARNPSFLGTQYTKIKSARKICTRTLRSNWNPSNKLRAPCFIKSLYFSFKALQSGPKQKARSAIHRFCSFDDFLLSRDLQEGTLLQEIDD